jgi:hypothetical protein
MHGQLRIGISHGRKMNITAGTDRGTVLLPLPLPPIPLPGRQLPAPTVLQVVPTGMRIQRGCDQRGPIPIIPGLRIRLQDNKGRYRPEPPGIHPGRIAGLTGRRDHREVAIPHPGHQGAASRAVQAQVSGLHQVVVLPDRSPVDQEAPVADLQGAAGGIDNVLIRIL